MKDLHRINNEYIESYLEQLNSYSGDEFMKKIEKKAIKMQLPILRGTVARFLDIIIRSSSIRSVLEIGTSIGYSTLVFLKAMEGQGKIVTIEMDEGLLGLARQNFREAGVWENVTSLLGDAGEILHYMEGQYDMIFLDGPKAQYLNYLRDCLRLLKPGGLLICDDVLFYGMIANDKLINKRKITIVKRMRKFLKIITAHPDLETIVLPLGDGLSISYKKKGRKK